MMKMKLAVLALMAAWMMSACKSEPKQEVSPLDVELVVTIDTLYRSLNNCDYMQGDCSFTMLVYPTIVSGPFEEELRAELNKAFFARLGEGGEPYADRQQMSDEFFKMLEQTKNEFPDMAGHWYIIRESRVKRANKRYISMSHTTNEYMGGAHPNYFTTYRSFDLSQGRWLTLADVFTNPSDEALTAIVDSAVRANRGIAAKASLTELGMFEAVIKPTENFELRAKGIHFFYNSYDIGPYSMGYSQAIIPYARLGAFLKEGFNVQE